MNPETSAAIGIVRYFDRHWLEQNDEARIAQAERVVKMTLDRELSKLRAEVERLTKERDEARENASNRLIGLCKAGDDIDALHTQLAEGEEDRWQPIETAPKDGRQILAYFVNDLDGISLVCLRWLQDEWVAGRLTSGRSVVQKERPPLGWQPLPQPPTSRAQPEDGK